MGKPDGAQSKGRLSSGSCVLCSGQTYGNDVPCLQGISITKLQKCGKWYRMDAEEEGIAANILDEVILMKGQPLLQLSAANLIKSDTGNANLGAIHFEVNVSGFFVKRLFLEDRQ